MLDHLGSRRVLLIAALGAAVIIGAFAAQNLASSTVYYLTPSEARDRKIPAGQTARLGGQIEAGTLRYDPATRDLRFVISVAKVTPILERIADHACNIARVALDLNDEPRLNAYVDLPRMASVAASMLRAALDAFTGGDAAAARRVIDEDDEIDTMYERVFHDLIELMVADPSATPRAARLLFVAKHLERVADYVTDICELTVYMAEAEFIKHSY